MQQTFLFSCFFFFLRKAAVMTLISENKNCYKTQGRTLYNDQGINLRRRYSNYKYICNPKWGTSINKAKTKSHAAAAAAAAAKSLRSCPTLCDPIDGSPMASLSLGFFRQEYWSGLPFPFPMHESKK